MNHRTLSIASEVKAVINNSGAILIDSKQGLMFKVNHVGSIIWKGLCLGQKSSDIARILASEFRISYEQAQVDVTGFISRLKEHHLLEEK